MIVYHGSIAIVKKPDVIHSLRPLDFGKGFYVTTIKAQAETWAKRKTVILNSKKAYVSLYEMSCDFSGLKHKSFGDDLSEWIDFVCECRDGGTAYEKYDVISCNKHICGVKIFKIGCFFRPTQNRKRPKP